MIDKLMNGVYIVDIITSDWCTYCHKAKDFLRQHHIPFNEYDVENSHAQTILMEHKLKTIPQIFVGGRLVGGYSDLKLYLEEVLENTNEKA